MKPFLRSFVLAAVAGLGLAACGPAGKSDFDAASARWANQGPARYSYTLQWGCFCPGDFNRPTRVTVLDGQISNAVDAETGEQVTRSQRDLRTIDGLFDLIEESFAQHAGKVDVKYDATDGHPTQGLIDHILNASDDELAFTATDLTAVP